MTESYGGIDGGECQEFEVEGTSSRGRASAGMAKARESSFGVTNVACYF